MSGLGAIHLLHSHLGGSGCPSKYEQGKEVSHQYNFFNSAPSP